MSEMVEIVARAIYAHPDGPVHLPAETFTLTDPHDGDCTNIAHTCYRCLSEESVRVARAVIEAMLEPTPEMLAAVLPETDIEVTPDDLRFVEKALHIIEPKGMPQTAHEDGKNVALGLLQDYRRMLSAALEEDK